MHSHNRHYSVDAWLTCEGTSFEKDSMILITDHLHLNLTELAEIVKHKLLVGKMRHEKQL